MSAGIRLPPLEALLDIYRREMQVTGGPAGSVSYTHLTLPTILRV